MGDDCSQGETVRCTYTYHTDTPLCMGVECPKPSYGDNCKGNCTSQCHISGTASMECHHIEGPKCNCTPGYTGDLCLISMLTQ